MIFYLQYTTRSKIMLDSNKQCFRCKKFDRYYVRGVRQFNRTDFGRCCEKQDSVNMHDCCDQFVAKTVRKMPKKMLSYCLSDLLTDISEIRKVIEDEYSEIREDENV